MAGRPIQWPDTQRTHLQQSQRVLPVHTHTAKVPAPAPHECPTVPRVCTTVQMILEQYVKKLALLGQKRGKLLYVNKKCSLLGLGLVCSPCSCWAVTCTARIGIVSWQFFRFRSCTVPMWGGTDNGSAFPHFQNK